MRHSLDYDLLSSSAREHCLLDWNVTHVDGNSILYLPYLLAFAYPTTLRVLLGAALLGACKSAATIL